MQRAGNQYGLLSYYAGDGGTALDAQTARCRHQLDAAVEKQRLIEAQSNLLALSTQPRKRQQAQRGRSRR